MACPPELNTTAPNVSFKLQKAKIGCLFSHGEKRSFVRTKQDEAFSLNYVEFRNFLQVI